MANKASKQSEFEKWSYLAERWINYLPPSRPSQQDLNIFKKLINTNCPISDKAKTLVLGSTPELRDLLYEMNASVTIVDRNPFMYEEMTRIRIYNNPETTSIDDWFSYLPAHKHSFSLIVSDLTQSNVPYHMHDEFYALVAESLVPGGVFIDRVYTYRDYLTPYFLDHELQHFAQSKTINLMLLNDFFVRCFLASDIVVGMGLVDTHEIYLEIKKRNDPTLNRLAKLLDEFLAPDGAIWYCGKPWAEISQRYYSHLTLLEEIPTNGVVEKDIAYIICSTSNEG